jgi:hypothetical protein
VFWGQFGQTALKIFDGRQFDATIVGDLSMQGYRGKLDNTKLGVAWYTRETWERLRELAADREVLDDTFENWEQGALAAVFELESAGRQVHKIPIDIDALVLWCREHGHRLDTAARAEYVMHLLQRAVDQTMSDRPPG